MYLDKSYDPCVQQLYNEIKSHVEKLATHTFTIHFFRAHFSNMCKHVHNASIHENQKQLSHLGLIQEIMHQYHEKL